MNMETVVPPNGTKPSFAVASAKSLLALLVCPACHDDLTLTVYEGTSDAPTEGLLRSGCGLWFPVVASIPRMFIGPMRSVYQTDFADFLALHGLSAEGAAPPDDATRMKLATRESFG